jgi:xylose isomerase
LIGPTGVLGGVEEFPLPGIRPQPAVNANTNIKLDIATIFAFIKKLLLSVYFKFEIILAYS